MVEAAFILPIFFFMIFAFLELSIILFFSFVLESAMYDAVRVAKIAPDPSVVDNAVRQAILDRSFGILPANEVVITTDLQATFADSPRTFGEQCQDSAGILLPDQYCPGCAGNFYNDANGNGQCDGPPPLDLGGPGAIVSVIAFYVKPPFTPGLEALMQHISRDQSASLNLSRETLIQSAVIFRNEPQ